jgi:hypothetical protein
VKFTTNSVTASNVCFPRYNTYLKNCYTQRHRDCGCIHIRLEIQRTSGTSSSSYKQFHLKYPQDLIEHGASKETKQERSNSCSSAHYHAVSKEKYQQPLSSSKKDSSINTSTHKQICSKERHQHLSDHRTKTAQDCSLNTSVHQ